MKGRYEFANKPAEGGVADLRRRLRRISRPPVISPDGLPRDGTRVGNGYAVRAISRGPEVTFDVRNPLGSLPNRVVSWDGSSNAGFDLSRSRPDRIHITPGQVPEGQLFVVVVN